MHADDPFAGIQKFFSGTVSEHGDGPKAVGWKDPVSQERGFAAVSEAFCWEKTPFEVYDVGCGLGAMQDFLTSHVPLARYSGCDINAEMIERAHAQNAKLDVELRDIISNPPPRRYDYVVACGIFNIKMDLNDRTQGAIVRDVLTAMYAVADRAVAATFLTTWVDYRLPIAYHQDPAWLLQWAQATLSPLAELRHGYYPWEFTLHVRRTPRPFDSAAIRSSNGL